MSKRKPAEQTPLLSGDQQVSKQRVSPKCPQCGRSHERGPINGKDVWRCLNCGTTYRPKQSEA
jgi:tRNA(Ile2) C34 agmatinyltransferase TiaS